MKSNALPLLEIEAGTSFGYHSGPFWDRKENRLVDVTDPVKAEAGLHLFVAPNGTGKTTFLRTLAGLNDTLSGKLDVKGDVLYISDELRLDPELRPRTLFRSLFKATAYKQAIELAEKLNLGLDTPVGKLSRGNRQKVLLIMAEIKLRHSEQSVVLMDEPLSGLDAETRESVLNLWAESSSQAVRLVVLHELESVQKADSLFTIKEGRLHHTREQHDGAWMETYQSLQE